MGSPYTHFPRTVGGRSPLDCRRGRGLLSFTAFAEDDELDAPVPAGGDPVTMAVFMACSELLATPPRSMITMSTAACGC